MLTQVFIENNDVTEHLINYEIEKVLGEAITQAELNFIQKLNYEVDLNEGDEIIIWRGWNNPNEERIFYGYIEKFETEGGKCKIIAKDKAWDLIRKEITQVYDKNIDPFQGKISEIFKDIVTTYGGLNADNSSIKDSGTEILLDKFVCNHTDLFERCKKLAEILDWQFYYDSNTDKVYFEPKGYELNPNTFIVGVNIYNVPKWNYDISEMINDVTVIGASQEIETTEEGTIGVTPGYTSTYIELKRIPFSTKVFIDSVYPPYKLLIGGIPGSTSDYDYYVDKNLKRIVAKEGTTFVGPYAEVRYSFYAPCPIHAFDNESIKKYGLFKKTITFTDIKTIADAEARAQGILYKYSNPFIYTTIKVKNNASYNLKVGQRISIVDKVNLPNYSGILVVVRHRIRYPSDYDEMDVGDKYWRLAEWNANIMEKFKRLEELENENIDIVYELVDVDNTINNYLEFLPRYEKLEIQTATAPNVFILGNPNHGRLGTDKLGDAGMSSPSIYTIIQSENRYLELFRDDDFKDVSNTTANWDTTNKKLLFAPNQVAQSLSIDYNNGNITSAVLKIQNTSGSFDYYLSADGGVNWESVTPNVQHFFTNTGQDLRWKIVENAGMSGEINEIKIIINH